MGFSLNFFLLLIAAPLIGNQEGNLKFALDYNPHIKKQIQFLAINGRVAKAVELYKEIKQKTGKHQTELLRELGIGLLERGQAAKDAETLLLTLFGAGISMDESAAHILSAAIESDIPELNLIALNFISLFSEENAEMLLLKALRSNYLPIRLEAIHRLSLVRHPYALIHAEALLCKLDGEVLGLFPEFFLQMDDPKANRIVKKLLMHTKTEVRIPTILSIVKHNRDDFLPMIKGLSLQQNIAEQEASAYALGVFKDTGSIKRLQTLANSPSLNVKLSALRALFQMGSEGAKNEICKMAKGGNLLAIGLLSQIPGSEDTLALIAESKDPHVVFNASIALLELKDPRGLKGAALFLIKDVSDIAITKSESIGKTLSSYKLIPSASQNNADTPLINELSLKYKEAILAKAALLREKEFLSLAKVIFETRQDELVPALVQLLENMETEGAIALLKKSSQQAGAPLVRSYANLSLYRLGIEGPYFDNLKDWIQNQKSVPLIRLRPLLPFNLWSRENTKTAFELAPEEQSRILVESFESFAKTQDERGLDVLIEMIAYGNPMNRYALAGILLRACL